MSADFRQRKPSEYLKILQRRKWLVILPAIAISVAVAYVVYRLPDVYESSTLIVVRPSTLPKNMTQTGTEDNLTRQLAGIQQVVSSRSSLEPLIQKYDLYKAERFRGEPIESVINMMRMDINVKVNTSRNEITNGFNISYRYRDAKTAQVITSELAGKYISVQTANQVNSGAAAKQFIDNQVSQTRDELAAIDKQRLDFMSNNVGKLPSEATGLFNQLSGLREEQKALIAEVGRLQDRRAAATSQLAVLKESRNQIIIDTAENITDPKTTQGWSQLVQRKAALEGELTRLKGEYKPIHPDVIAKQQEVNQVKEQMDSMVDEWKEKIKIKQEKLEKNPSPAITQAEAEIKLADGEIKRQQKMLAEQRAGDRWNCRTHQQRSRCRSRVGSNRTRVPNQESSLRRSSGTTTEDWSQR